MLPINIDNLSSYLAPPMGYSFDKGFSTTYSLHLDILLTIPMFLDGGLNEEFAVAQNYYMIVKMIERYKDKFNVYVQKGEIKTSPKSASKASTLYELLRPMIKEVPKNTKGTRGSSFHPKVWFLRYLNVKGQYAYKLIVLSKNLTNASDFDIAVVFEGKSIDASKHKKINQKLYRFYNSFEKEPIFTLDEIKDIEWDNIKGFELEDFLVIPKDKKSLPFLEDRKLKPNTIVFSPFISGNLFHANNLLVTREEELKSGIECRNIYKLNNGVSSDEEDNEYSSNQLHAKMYIFTNNKKNYLFLGSSNCSNRGLLNNDEFNVLLKAPSGFYNQIRDYIEDEKKAIFEKIDLKYIASLEAEKNEREKILDEIDDLKNWLLQDGNLKIKVSIQGNKLIVDLKSKIDTSDELQIFVTPVSRNAYQLLDKHLEWDLREDEVTGWFSFKITKDGYSREFLVNSSFSIPKSTKAAILKKAQEDSSEYFKYNVLALLSDGRKAMAAMYDHSGDHEGTEHNDCYSELIENDIVDLMLDRYATDKRVYKDVYELLKTSNDYDQVITCLPEKI